jgi:predicted metal-dependent hydrolase
MPTSTLAIPDIGNVTFTRSVRARYLRLTVRPDKTVIVTIPRRGSLDEAKQFLTTKISWIQKQLQKIERRTQHVQTPDLNIDFEKAQEELFRRLEYFSEKYKLPINRASFRCQRTRWGSCSYKNNINLNVNMAFLPVELQDYIIVHELVHTRVKNHSKIFWNELDKYTEGKARELAKKLRKHRINLIA